MPDSAWVLRLLTHRAKKAKHGLSILLQWVRPQFSCFYCYHLGDVALYPERYNKLTLIGLCI